MNPSNAVSNRLAIALRWSARGVGSLAAASWLFVIIAGAVAKEEPWTSESTVLTVLGAASALGVLIAWRKEGLGGLLLVACGIAGNIFGWIAAGRNKAVAMLVTGGPFVVAGLLFIGSWWLLRRRTAGA
ncbi:MAG: hypothetical protein D6743_01960 [Calditrichaeota bacterium]|nr:MAG: hypothetical protein D6743_01960 [Calditrichota bacterium]